MNAKLYTDGGARGNPGPAGIGYVLIKTEAAVIEYGEYIGEATNNQAEYKALLAGLARAQREGVRAIDCFLDSELVVRQLNGQYRVKNPDLVQLVSDVKKIANIFTTVSFTHIPRAENAKADALVNTAIDEAQASKNSA